jgi:zinc transporter ZupT
VDKTALVVVLATVAAGGNVFGGALTLWGHLRGRRLLRLIALGGGFLVGAALIDMLPTTMALGPAVGPLAILGGYVGLLFLEMLVTHHAHRYDLVAGEVPDHDHDHDRPLLAGGTAAAVWLGMIVHTFFDGVSIAAGLASGGVALGVLMFEAVILHNAGDGFSLSSVVLAAHRAEGGRRRAFASALSIGASTLGGAVVTLLLGGISAHTSDVLLGVSAGTFLYIGMSDLIPAVHASHDRLNLAYFVAGIALFWLSHALMGLVGLA